jgi:hypothetical protein
MYRRAPFPARALFIAGLLLAPPAFAQSTPARGTIVGVTLDSASNTPRFGVVITLEGTGRTAQSDSAGQFILRDIAAGSYTLRTRMLSTRSVEQPVVVVANDTTRVMLFIATAAVKLTAVTTSARSPERARFELSPNVGSIQLTGSSVSHVPALGEPDVLRTVQLMPGVNARNDFSSGFNVRGGESDQNLILLDGYPIYNPFHLGGLFSTFLDETVGSIDLLTGGFTAPYGGRLSSVLDVKSQPSTRTGIHGTSSISVISSSLSLGSASQDGRSSWTVSGRRTYADKLIAALSTKDFPYHFSDAQFHGERALNSKDLRVELTAYAGSDVLDANLSAFQDSASKGSGPGAFVFGWSNQVIGAKLTNAWREHAWLPLTGSGDSVTASQHVSLTRFATALNLAEGALSLSNSVHEMRVEGSLHWFKGTRERQIGYEGSTYATHYDVNSAASAAQLFNLSQNPSALSVYYDERWKPSEKLVTEVGVRAEHVSGRDWTGISPRLSAKYFINRDLAVSAAVGRYAQWMHSLNREDIPVRIFDFWVASDKYTPVSEATHAVLGLEKWLGPLRFARVEAWAKDYDHLLEQNTADDPGIRGDEWLVSTGRSYGVDLLMRQLEIGTFGGWLAYTYSVSTRSRDSLTYWPGHDRRHNLNLVGTWKPGNRYVFSARFGLATGTPYTDIVGQVMRRVYDVHTHTYQNVSEIAREPLGGDHNGSRLPIFQRLDLGVSRNMQWRGLQITPYLSVVNAYNAKNVFIYSFDYTTNPPTRAAESQFPLLPSLGMTVSF